MLLRRRWPLNFDIEVNGLILRECILKINKKKSLTNLGKELFFKKRLRTTMETLA